MTVKGPFESVFHAKETEIGVILIVLKLLRKVCADASCAKIKMIRTETSATRLRRLKYRRLLGLNCLLVNFSGGGGG